MDCESFKQWLENRDMHDVSESDLAQRHARRCATCGELLQKDELLDQVFSRGLAAVALPPKLQGQIDLNLAHCHRTRSRRRFLFKFVPALIAAMLVIYLVLPFSPVSPGMERMGSYALAHHAAFINAGVEVTDMDEVADWCRDKVSFRVVLPNLPADQYRFVGGRVCALGDCSAVQLRYMEGETLVSVYIMDEREVDFGFQGERSLEKDGKRLSFWKGDSLVYVLVS